MIMQSSHILKQHLKSMSEAAIGINLGTTYCCMSYYDKDGAIKIIPNNEGQTTTPSQVCLEQDKTRVVGWTAKRMGHQEPAETIYDVKRLIGLSFDHPKVQECMKQWPFKVENENNVAKIVMRGKRYHPEQVSGFILYYLRLEAEKYLKKYVTKAVITVPAYFNERQRQSTRFAAEIAGFETVRLLNEPTAAAIAYRHLNYFKEQQKLLVFDLGGGTFDLSLVFTDGHEFDVKAIGGDCHLGGEDFDNNLVDFCVRTFEEKHGGDVYKEKTWADSQIRFKAQRKLRRLKEYCEVEKINLSTANSAMVGLDAFHRDNDLAVRVTRTKFNELNAELFSKTIKIMDQLFIDANMDRDSIDQVVMVGGSSRIPRIKELVAEYFRGRNILTTVFPEELVAYGAGHQAGLILTKKEKALGLVPTLLDLHEVIALPIGIQTCKSLFTNELKLKIIIPQNAKVPSSGSFTGTTLRADTATVVTVRQGIHKDVFKNEILAKFECINLPPNSPMGTQIHVDMKVDAEGLLTVTCSYNETDKTDSIAINMFKGRLTQEEVDRLKIK